LSRWYVGQKINRKEKHADRGTTSVPMKGGEKN